MGNLVVGVLGVVMGGTMLVWRRLNALVQTPTAAGRKGRPSLSDIR